MNALVMNDRARLPQIAVEQAVRGAERIRPLVRLESPSLTAACTSHGLPVDIAALCGGLLASVIEDLVRIGDLPRKAFERTKRMQRVLATADEPAVFALRLAIASSQVNGRAAVAHWDVICEPNEIGKFAWLLGVDTENAYVYGRRITKRGRK